MHLDSAGANSWQLLSRKKKKKKSALISIFLGGQRAKPTKQASLQKRKRAVSSWDRGIESCNLLVRTVQCPVWWLQAALGTMSAARLEEFRGKIRSELDSVVDFWLRHSHDTVHG